MKVHNTGTQAAQAAEAQSSKKTGKAAEPQKNQSAAAILAGESAKAQISDAGKDLNKARAAAMSAPDVREDKVAELRKRIAEGKYNVKPEAIADRLVDEHLSMSGLG